MNNSVPPSVNTGEELDSFGIASEVHDYPEDINAETHASDVHESAVPQKKSVGLPMAAVIGLSIVGLLMAGFIVFALVNVLSKKPRADAINRQVAEAQQAAQSSAAAVESSSLMSLRGEIALLKSSIATLEVATTQLRSQVESVSRGVDPTLSGRVGSLETTASGLKSTVAGFEKKIINERPMDFDLTARDDVRVVSIGSGSARLAANDGRETVVRKGDTWSGLKVMAIRADKGVVVLSDGSVLR